MEEQTLPPRLPEDCIYNTTSSGFPDYNVSVHMTLLTYIRGAEIGEAIHI